MNTVPLSQDEKIAAEIKWLKDNKPKIRRLSSFGDDHWAAIDAQIQVLEDRLSEDEVDVEFEYAEENIQVSAMDAAHWMGGEEELRPSGADNWGSLVKK